MSDGKRSYWVTLLPAGVALVIIGLVLVLTARKEDVPATAVPSATPAPPSAVAPPPTASIEVAPAIATASVSAAVSASASVEKVATPAEMIAAAIEAGVPPPTFIDELPKGKAWTKEEKLERAKNSIKTIELREKLLEDEIAAADKAGNKTEADEKRVLLMRLRKHKAEILTKLDAGEPP